MTNEPEAATPPDPTFALRVAMDLYGLLKSWHSAVHDGTWDDCQQHRCKQARKAVAP